MSIIISKVDGTVIEFVGLVWGHGVLGSISACIHCLSSIVLPNAQKVLHQDQNLGQDQLCYIL